MPTREEEEALDFQQTEFERINSLVNTERARIQAIAEAERAAQDAERARQAAIRAESERLTAANPPPVPGLLRNPEYDPSRGVSIHNSPFLPITSGGAPVETLFGAQPPRGNLPPSSGAGGEFPVTPGGSPVAPGTPAPIPTPGSPIDEPFLPSIDNPFDLSKLEGTLEGQRTIFGSQRPDFLKTGQQQDIFANMFDRTKNDFLSTIGQDFDAGRLPSTTFTDFVKNRDFGREIRREGIGRNNTSQLRSAANFLFDR